MQRRQTGPVISVEVPNMRGAKPIHHKLPRLVEDLHDVVRTFTQTDPRFRTSRRYTRLSAATVVKRLVSDKGYQPHELPSHETIRRTLHEIGYTMRKVRKARPKKKLPETDAIFEHIHIVNCTADEQPNELRLSLDAKAAVKVGPFSRGGSSWVDIKADDHDFNPEHILVPIGILVPQWEKLSMYIAKGRAPADALADALNEFWHDNHERAELVDTLVLDLDNGPENHSRRTQFISRLVQFVDEHQVNIRLAYYPPYHSKYNPVERCWGVLENHWNGSLLDSVEAVVGYASTMTWKGIRATVKLFDKVYERGKKLSAKAMQAIEQERLARLPGLEKYFVDILHSPALG